MNTTDQIFIIVRYGGQVIEFNGQWYNWKGINRTWRETKKAIDFFVTNSCKP